MLRAHFLLINCSRCNELQVANSSQALLTTVVDDFQTHMKQVDQLYTVHCCKGLALEMLAALAEDLNFQ